MATHDTVLWRTHRKHTRHVINFHRHVQFNFNTKWITNEEGFFHLTHAHIKANDIDTHFFEKAQIEVTEISFTTNCLHNFSIHITGNFITQFLRPF